MTIDVRLDGRIAFVTGCRSGIGRAIAVAFAEAGAEVIGVSSKLDLGDSELMGAIESRGGRFHPYRCDLSDRKALYRLLEEVRGNHPVVDIVVNNAGVIRRAPVLSHSDDDWDRVMSVNLDAPFIVTRELAAGMVQRRRGKVIFIASLLSYQGGITVPGYSASKGAIKQLVMALSNELSSRGVCVNGIAPGYIETDATRALRDDPERSKAIVERIPAGRWGTPEDIAGAAVFLASSAANYITGTTLVVDGGWMGR